MLLFIALFCSTFIFPLASGFHNTFHDFDLPPDTVTSLNLTAYSGRWYQIYDSYFANKTYEKNSYCVTADIEYISERKLNITSSAAVGSPNSALFSEYAIAYKLNMDDPGKWLAKYNVPWLEWPIIVPYWIIKLGPLTTDGYYSYSVVSQPLGFSLSIYARNVTEFRGEYAASLIRELKSMGFSTPYNSPLETYQGRDCNYLGLDESSIH